MIKKLQNHTLDVAEQIHSLFQLSYAVEAKLLKSDNFPPLKRPLESYLKNDTLFFAYLDNDEFVGIIEIKQGTNNTNINSLVVNPNYFRRGIARKLIAFVFSTFESESFTVETGLNNFPANELYKKLGFIEIKQWDTDFGIRKIRFKRRVTV